MVISNCNNCYQLHWLAKPADISEDAPSIDRGGIAALFGGMDTPTSDF
jgi:hypothetical protein